MLGGIGSGSVTARCPVGDCHRPIRSWRLWRRQPAQLAADIDTFFPVLSRVAGVTPASAWDPFDLAFFAGWGEWARLALHDWAHGDRVPTTRLPSEVALAHWCAKAHTLWEAMVQIDPVWCALQAATTPGLELPRHGHELADYDIAV